MIVPWDLYALKRLTNEITGVDGAVVWSRERDTRNMCAVSSAGLQTPERKPGVSKQRPKLSVFETQPVFFASKPLGCLFLALLFCIWLLFLLFFFLPSPHLYSCVWHLNLFILTERFAVVIAGREFLSTSPWASLS